MRAEMKTLSVLLVLVGILVGCAASQSAPAPQNAPANPPAAAAEKPAPPPSFASPIVPPKKAEAAKPADEDSEAVTTFRKRVDEVNVIFTVTDKHGHFIKDLKKDDVRVLDDHKPPSSVVQFRSETDLPLRVGLLIDASNSI